MLPGQRGHRPFGGGSQCAAALGERDNWRQVLSDGQPVEQPRHKGIARTGRIDALHRRCKALMW